MKTGVVIVGPAGSGKSSVTGAYGRWLREEMYADVYIVNLDPAAERLPYKPDFDVRQLVDARDVARRYGLGPNGALVKSMELLTERLDVILDAVGGSGAEYVLVDTPGQMEVFLFRDLSDKFSHGFQRAVEKAFGFFILDATLLHSPLDYAFLYTMALAVELRLELEIAPVVNKADLGLPPQLTGDLRSDHLRLTKLLKGHHSVYAEMLREIVRKLVFYARKVEIPRISALKGEGLEDLHRLLYEMQCNCGDLS